MSDARPRFRDGEEGGGVQGRADAAVVDGGVKEVALMYNVVRRWREAELR